MADLTGMDTTQRMRGEQYKLGFYAWNGRNRMRRTDGNEWVAVGIQRARFRPDAATNGAGVLTGRYKYYAVPINANVVNLFGRPKQGIPSFGSAVLTTASNKVQLTNIPATHEDAQVTHWEIYRNLSNRFDDNASDDTQDFYPVGRVPIGTSTFDDNVPDSVLTGQVGVRILNFNAELPPSHECAVIYGDRLFSFGFTPLETGTVTKASKTISNKQITLGRLVTITATAHGYSAGQRVTIGMDTPDPVLDGTQIIKTVPSADTFTYEVDTTDNVGSTAVSGTAQVINCSSSVIADGLVGTWFIKDGASLKYRVTGRNSATQFTLDSLHAASLSASAYTIWRDGWEIIASDFGDFDAWGPESEGARWRREVPGRDEAMAGIVVNGNLIIFTPLSIYAISGKGTRWEDIKITPEPIYRGLGSVCRDVYAIDGECYFMSTRGPCVLRGGAPQMIGQKLLTDWLDGLNASEQRLCTVFGSGNNVWFAYPVADATENSKCWRFERDTQSWWPETEMHPRFGFNDDGDDGSVGNAFYAQGKFVIQPDYGTLDLVDAALAGAVTTGGTTTLDCAAATFPTSGGGLIEAYVRVFRTTAGVQSFVGARRITANTGTQLTWASSGSGGGSLTVAIGDTIEIGKPWWKWKTRSMSVPGHVSEIVRALIEFGSAPGAGTDGYLATSIRKTDYVDQRAQSNTHELGANQLQKPWPINQKCTEYAALLESRNLATLRHLTLQVDTKGGEK